jgi:hypothetical protein
VFSRIAIRLGLIAAVLIGALPGALAQSGEEPVTPSILPPPRFNFSNVGARSSGAGGAFVGLADDATAAWFNPAGLTQLEEPQVSLALKQFTERRILDVDRSGGFNQGDVTQTSRTSDTQFVNVTWPLGKERPVRQALGLSQIVVAHSATTLAQQPENQTAYRNLLVDQAEYEVTVLSYAHRLKPETTLGLSLNLVDRKYRLNDLRTFGEGEDPEKASLDTVDRKQVLGATLGILYAPPPERHGTAKYGLAYRSRLGVGGAVDINNSKDARDVFDIPAAVITGVSFAPRPRREGDVPDTKYMMDVETIIGHSLGRGGRDVVNVHLGTEKRFFVEDDVYTLRAGFFTLRDGTPNAIRGGQPAKRENQTFWTAGVGAFLSQMTRIDLSFEHSNRGVQEFTLSIMRLLKKPEQPF